MAAIKKASAKGRTEDEFSALYDKSVIVPRKIKAALAALGESWEPEVDFLRRCGLSTTDFSRFREPFMAHSVTTTGTNPKRIWAGTVKFAAKLRERVK
jgi:hypothetical protein